MPSQTSWIAPVVGGSVAIFGGASAALTGSDLGLGAGASLAVGASASVSVSTPADAATGSRGLSAGLARRARLPSQPWTAAAVTRSKASDLFMGIPSALKRRSLAAAPASLQSRDTVAYMTLHMPSS